MSRFLSLIVSILLIASFVRPAFGAQSEAVPDKKTLEFGISFSIPPWVIKDENSGIELDILKIALSSAGYQVEPVYVPFALAFKLFEAGKIDGVINAREGVVENGYLSQQVVTFQNVAVSLRHKGFPEHFRLDFLRDKSVVAFQRASDLLGEEFSAMATSNSRYQEIGKQSLQINLLFVRDVDFIVMDQSIFGYYWQEAKTKHAQSIGVNFNQAVKLHYVFPPSPYRFLFKDDNVRKAFDDELTKMRADGRYEEILNKYDHLSRLYERYRQ